MASPKHIPFASDLFFGATPTPHHTSASRASTHPDEGYSEEPRSMDASDSEMVYSQDPDEALARIYALSLALPLEQRVNLIRRLIETVPNAEKENVGKYCVELTHFDPAAKLPNELMFSVLSYLSPNELLACGTVSSMWRDRAQDEKLWRCCFAQEGWVVDRSKLDRYEERARDKGAKYVDGVRRGNRTASVHRHSSKKRKQGDAFSDSEGRPRVPEDASMTSDAGASSERMEGVERAPTPTMSPADALMDAGRSAHSSASASADSASPPQSSSSFDPAIQQDHQQFDPAPKLFRPGPADQPKLSWPYIYKQRARLEKNWETEGAHKMFCLPHPKYPLEGHTECVYTIQHTPKHLVSGSRDKTIRKWDLNSCRLIGKPMIGHEASVLCLQYDERPDQDIIVSGGSDARVIIWKFSTGEMIKNIEKAHRESVLNLRFDDRYIVTCSKDKTIKVWNRQQLAKDDPLIPIHTLQHYASLPAHMSDMPGGYIPAFTELAELRGHQAAVNAVMIHGNTIISASGDRTIKSWDIKHARLSKQYVGHLKGIACVQFDGRRIVSGSSDNTVRIFDAEHQAEVACLTGHANLVRTVQARFGDLDTVTDEELESEARRADDGFYRALENGLSPASASRGAPRNAGSSRPEDMLTLGAKVPPGGGGSRWAKIVSGSYDESVIIWKRNQTGRWVKKLTLRQDELLSHLFPHESRSRQPRVPHVNQGHLAPLPQPHGAQQQGQGQNPVNVQVHGPQHLLQNPTPQMQNAINHITQLSQALQANAQAGHYGTNINVTAHNVTVNAAPGQSATNANHAPQQAPATHAVAPQAAGHNQAGPAPPLAPAAAPAANTQQPAAQQQQQHHHHPHAANAAAQQARNNHTGESNRIFKLQFDARRIICCSQNKVIVGWDFANGDQELERVGEWSVETA